MSESVPSQRIVKMSTLLDPAMHRFLTTYCGQVASDLDRPRVASTTVIRALLDELAVDEGLRARIHNRIASNPT